MPFLVDFVGAGVGDLGAVEGDVAAAGANGAGDGAQGGGLADAVAAQQGDGFAFVDDEGEVFQDDTARVAGAELVDDQDRFGGGVGRAVGVGRRGWRDDAFGAQVGGDDVGVAGDLGGVAVGDQAALVQHGDAVGQSEHAVDVVLDQQHGVGVGELADQCADHLAVGFGEAGERFVEQQQLGVGGQRDGDFQQAALAVAEVGAGVRGAVFEADGF